MLLVQDNYCPDKALLERLSSLDVWESTKGRFHWWSGWWNQEPRNDWEHIAQMIWQPKGVEKRIAGFEYWVNVLDGESDVNYLGWHRDKDELRFATTGETQCPIAGTVFYAYPHVVEGGFLEMATEPTFTDVERIRPVFNRVVILDVSKQHRVSRIYKGKRVGLQINLWNDKPQTFLKADVTVANAP